MSQTQSPSKGAAVQAAACVYRVCRVWQFPRSTVHEHRRRAALRPEERLERKKRGPKGPCTDDELSEKIRELLKASASGGRLPQDVGWPSCGRRTSAPRRSAYAV